MKNCNTDLLVYIIVLCCNSKAWLYKCISSLLKTNYNNFKILLVDNASTDGSVEEISVLFSDVIIIKNKQNYGWCEGNNIGIRYALEHDADMVFLSNADMEYHRPDWLVGLVETYKQNTKYVILGPLQYEYGNENVLNEWSKYILENGNRNVHYMWSDLLNSNGRFYKESDLLTPFLEVYFVQGAAMLIHKNAFKNIGLFDPLYYIFFDEVDFSRRNLRIGNRIAIVPSSQVKHFGSGDNNSSRKMKKKKKYYFSRSKYIFHLSDYQMKRSTRNDVLKKWIQEDIKDALHEKHNINGLGQLIIIWFQIIINLPSIIKKRRREKIMEREIIISKVTECIVQLVPMFTKDDIMKNLNVEFGLDSIGIMELLIIIEEEFNIVFGTEVDMTQLYSPDFIIQYIYEYQR